MSLNVPFHTLQFCHFSTRFHVVLRFHFSFIITHKDFSFLKNKKKKRLHLFSAPFCNLQRAPSWFTVGWEIAAVLLRFGGMRLIVGDVSEGTVDHSLDRKYSNSSKWVILQRNWWYFFYFFFGFLCNVCAYVSLCVRCSVSVCIKGNERVCVCGRVCCAELI